MKQNKIRIRNKPNPLPVSEIDMHWRLAPIACALTACFAIRGRPAAAPPSSAKAVGTFAAKLAVAGKSTYTGTLQLESTSPDSVRGALRLTSPVTVNAIVSGVVRRDSLLLAGTYSGANGCAGDLKASLALPTAQSGNGLFQLADKCAGTLGGTMTVTR